MRRCPVRIRSISLRKAALGAAVSALAVLAHEQPAAAQDATAINGASPDTERILNELRSGTAQPATEGGADATADAPSDAGDGQPAPALRTDGSLAEPPAANPVTQDGLLRDQQAQQPVDGDLGADGRAAAPSDPLTDQVEAATPTAVAPPPANARVIDGETDARATAGRVRPVAEEDTAVARLPAPPPDDTAPEDANNLDAVPPPALRAQVTDIDSDPYGAVGIRTGGFLLLPTLTADTLYSDNVRQSASNRQSDMALVLRPGASLQSQWSRHSLSLDLRGAATSFAEVHAADTKALNATMRGRLDVTGRSSLEAEAAYDFNTLPSSDPTVPVGAALLPTAQTESAGLAYNQRFDRLSLRLHGATAETVQSDSGSGGQDYRDNGLDLRAAYEYSPRLTLFSTAKTFVRNYADSSGIDAAGNDVRIGVETDRSAKLSATASLGGAGITARDGAAAGASGVVADASVTWLPSALTTWTLAASSDLQLTNTTGAVALRNSQASLDLRHQFRRWFALMAGVSGASRDYSGIDLHENQLTEHVGFEYDFNREWALLGDYSRTGFTSSTPDRSYTEDQVKLGVRLQR